MKIHCILLFTVLSFSAIAANPPDSSGSDKILQGIKAADEKIVKADEGLKAAELQVKSEKPKLEYSRDSAAGVRNDIKANHDDIHPEGSAELEYWRAEWGKANNCVLEKENDIKVIDDNYQYWSDQKTRAVEERKNLVSSFLSSIEKLAMMGQCKQEFEAAKLANPADMNSFALEKLSHCASIPFDGTRMNVKSIEGFIEVAGPFGSSAPVVVFSSTSMENSGQKLLQMQKQMDRGTYKPLKIKEPPPPYIPPPAPPSLSDQLKRLLKDINKNSGKRTNTSGAPRG